MLFDVISTYAFFSVGVWMISRIPSTIKEEISNIKNKNKLSLIFLVTSIVLFISLFIFNNFIDLIMNFIGIEIWIYVALLAIAMFLHTVKSPYIHFINDNISRFTDIHVTVFSYTIIIIVVYYICERLKR